MVTILNDRFLISINEVVDSYFGSSECFYDIYDTKQSKVIMSDRYDGSKEVLVMMIKYALNLDSMAL